MHRQKASLSRKLLSLHLEDSGYFRFKIAGFHIEGRGGEPRMRWEKEEQEGEEEEDEDKVSSAS